MSEQILIASNSWDEDNVTPVRNILVEQGYDVVDYQADQVAYGATPFTAALSSQGEIEVTYDNQTLRPEAVAAAWSRRPNYFGLSFDTEDRGTRISLDSERTASQQVLFDLVPDERWLNAPEKMKYASRKLTQLALARSVGFETPVTVVSNEWDAIIASLPEGPIVFKSFWGQLYEGSEEKLVRTNVLHNDKAQPPLSELPYPGMWQTYHDKAREWRVTVVGDDRFDAAVQTAESAKDDWRRYQFDPSQVTFEHGKLPDAEAGKCHELLTRYGLRFGAFDLIEQPDGRFIFLEVNPNGQFMWLEDRLGLPISQAIASELGKIARS